MSLAGGVIFVIGAGISYIAHLSVKEIGELLDLDPADLEDARPGDLVGIKGKITETFRKECRAWVVKEFVMNRTYDFGGIALSILGKGVGRWQPTVGGFENASFLLDADRENVEVDFGNRWCEGNSIGKVIKGTFLGSIGFFDSDFRETELLEADEKLPKPLDGKFETPSEAKEKDYDFESATSYDFGQRKIFKGEVEKGDNVEVIGILRTENGSKVLRPHPEKRSIIATPSLRGSLKREYRKGKAIFYFGIILAVIGLALVPA